MFGGLLGKTLMAVSLAAIVGGAVTFQITDDRMIALAVALAAALVVALIAIGLVQRRLAALSVLAQRAASAAAGPMPGPLGDELQSIRVAVGHLQRRVDEQVRRAASLESRNGELIANVSHDLRTPLASMRGYLETLLLKQGSLSDEQQRHYLEVAEKQCERLGKLITDLFELTKFEANDVSIHAEWDPLESTCRHASLSIL